MTEKTTSIARASAKTVGRLPAKLASLFADVPLVGSEKRADYQKLFDGIAEALKPRDTIAWLFVRRITDLTWEIKREKNLKHQVLNSAYIHIIEAGLVPRPYLMPHDSEEEKSEKNEQWKKRAEAEFAKRTASAQERKQLYAEMADKGYDADYLMRNTLSSAANRIDAIDRRIAAYEMRWMAALRSMGSYNESLARQLWAAASEAIDKPPSLAAE